MHALGLEHEHQRPDRDKFIRILWENVEPDKHLNFEKIPHADVDLYHTYDYHSLMHYDGTAFGKTDTDTGAPMTTMEPLRDGVELTDNFELTKFDVEKLQILSKCKQKRRRKLRPGMDPKLITDPGSVERTAECADRSANCGVLKKNGFCWEIRYVRLIRIQCQHTCGFCENEHGNGATKKQGKNGIGNQNQGQNMGKDNGQDLKINVGLDNAGGQDGNEEYDMQNGGQEWEHGIDLPTGEDRTMNGNRGQELSMFGLDKTEGQAEENHGKMGVHDLDYGNGIDEEWHSNNNNIADGNDSGTRHGNDGIGTTNSQNGNANGQINGQEEQKQAESNFMDKKKQKKKLLLLTTSDEADLNNPKLLNKVDEHYTKWTFPKRRKPIGNGDETDQAVEKKAWHET